MKHIRSFILLGLTAAIPLVYSGNVLAAEPIVQELHVTAAVPHHRDIVLDSTGKILMITSNTQQDVMPTVYVGSIDPKNKKPLSDKLYGQYRQYVPVGTAEYGILYQRGSPVSLLRNTSKGIATILQRTSDS